MKKLLLLCLFVASTAFGGQLSLAVISFPEVKTADALEAAFADVNLAEITDSDKTMTGESYLKGGYVTFSQTATITRGGSFSVGTRLSLSRADVTGRLGADDVAVSIAVSEGVNAGIRRFSRKNYEGRGSLPNGVVRVLSLKQSSGKAPSVVKGQAKMVSYSYCIVVVAQYIP